MAATPSAMLPLGSSAADFELPDTRGRAVARHDFAGRPLLVVFICNHCPFVLHIAATLGRLGAELQAAGLGIVAINANDAGRYPADAPEHMAAHAQRYGYTFAYLHDATQAVARAYHAACTPDFFLYDRDHRLAYRGEFDGSRPGNAVPVTGASLRAAATALLAGGRPAAEQRPAIGCSIKWRAATP